MLTAGLTSRALRSFRDIIVGVGHPECDRHPSTVYFSGDVFAHRTVTDGHGGGGETWQCREVEIGLDPPGGVSAVDELLTRENDDVGGQRGGHALNDGLFDSAQHSSTGLFSVRAPHHELANQVVVELRDRVAGYSAGDTISQFYDNLIGKLGPSPT